MYAECKRNDPCAPEIPLIVNEAFAQNVLITTEETFMPFQACKIGLGQCRQARNHANMVMRHAERWKPIL